MSVVFEEYEATFIQLSVPNEMRGRVMSLYTVTRIGLPSIGADRCDHPGPDSIVCSANVLETGSASVSRLRQWMDKAREQPPPVALCHSKRYPSRLRTLCDGNHQVMHDAVALENMGAVHQIENIPPDLLCAPIGEMYFYE